MSEKGARILAPFPLFFLSAAVIFPFVSKMGGGSCSPPFFVCILYDFIVGKRPFREIYVHSLISLISDIIALFDIRDIIYCNRLNGIYYHLPFFLIENIRDNWMQAHMPNVIHTLFSEKRVHSIGYSLSCRSL